MLSQGRLVQRATPRETYSEPADTYVARRLGSPRVNLLPARRFPDMPAPFCTTTATIGLRPEDVLLNGPAPLGHVPLVQALGAKTVIEIDLAGEEARALLTPGERVRRGGVHITPRPGRALFFDPQGSRIAAAVSEPR